MLPAEYRAPSAPPLFYYLVIGIVLLAVLSFPLNSRSKQVAADLDNLQTRQDILVRARDTVQQLKPQVDAMKAQTSTVKEQQQALVDFGRSLSISVRWAEVLSALDGARTPDIQLSSVEIGDQGAIRLQGTVASVNSLSAYDLRLRQNVLFDDSPGLITFRQDPQNPDRVVFTITQKLAPEVNQ